MRKLSKIEGTTYSWKKKEIKHGIPNPFGLKFEVRKDLKHFECRHAVKSILFGILSFIYKLSLMKLT